MSAARLRRQPPPFRRVEVTGVRSLSPHLIRITFTGELDGLTVDRPAASLRLLLPPPGRTELEMPTWNGNEFLFADGKRPTIRTFTPRRVDPAGPELDLDIVLHDAGIASGWAGRAEPGDQAAVSGPGRGYVIDPDAPGFLLAGDETAIPAVSQLLEVLPTEVPVQVLVEVARPDARLDLPDHPGASVEWLDLPPGGAPGDALVPAVEDIGLDAGTQVWVAGEAAAVQRIRRHLFQDRGMARSQATVRGYWKRGRGGDGDE